MSVRFKPYRKRDGELMLYINGTNGVSLGLLGTFAPYGRRKATRGQINLYARAQAYFDANATPFTGDLKTHQEEITVCGEWTLALTDVANVGGHTTGADGAFLVKDTRILHL